MDSEEDLDAFAHFFVLTGERPSSVIIRSWSLPGPDRPEAMEADNILCEDSSSALARLAVITSKNCFGVTPAQRRNKR